jgi:aspartate 1-decarboxylase
VPVVLEYKVVEPDAEGVLIDPSAMTEREAVEVLRVKYGSRLSSYKLKAIYGVERNDLPKQGAS